MMPHNSPNYNIYTYCADKLFVTANILQHYKVLTKVYSLSSHIHAYAEFALKRNPIIVDRNLQPDYVKLYMENHKQIPTWIMIKVVNFSTFIDVLEYSKTAVTHALCQLYDMTDDNGYPNVKLLIGSLHWLQKVRNSCAHNERIYCIHQSRSRNPRMNNTGRIKEMFLASMHPPYSRNTDKQILDLQIFLNYSCNIFFNMVVYFYRENRMYYG